MKRTDIQVMLDTETLSTEPNAIIVSIGGVKFTIDDGIIDRFYITIDPSSSERYGLIKDQSTLEWWKKQSKEAILAWAGSDITLPSAITSFKIWYGLKSLTTWAHGIDFDFPIIRSSINAVGMQCPWNYWNQMDSRTIFALVGDGIKTNQLERVGEFHNAQGDAETQAIALIEILKEIVDV